MTRIDIDRLRRDVANRLRRRPTDVRPDGRRLTGAMAAVRKNLAEIRALRETGATWAEIADGLAAQGVKQGKGDRITAKRLTALVDSVERQAKRQREREEKRLLRADLVRARPDRIPADAATRQKLLLSAELRARPEVPAASPSSTEEDIRREGLAQVRKLLKSKPENKD